MTAHRSFKRLVRDRMARTGESYTAARSVLLSAREPEVGSKPVLATTDDRIRERTGLGWEEWFDLLDEQGMLSRPHRETARWVAERLGVVPLAWSAQAVTGSYERARGGRAVGEHEDGFRITASKTLPAPAEAIFDAFCDEPTRAGWLGPVDLRPRTATRPRSARFDWAAGPGRIHVTIDAKSAERATLRVEHIRLADAAEAAERKAWWRDRLTTLAATMGRANDV